MRVEQFLRDIAHKQRACKRKKHAWDSENQQKPPVQPMPEKRQPSNVPKYVQQGDQHKRGFEIHKKQRKGQEHCG